MGFGGCCISAVYVVWLSGFLLAFDVLVCLVWVVYWLFMFCFCLFVLLFSLLCAICLLTCLWCYDHSAVTYVAGGCLWVWCCGYVLCLFGLL